MATNSLPGKMPSVRLQLHLKAKNDTTGYIRVSVNVYGSNKPVRKSLGQSIPVKYWDAENEIVKRPYPDADEINGMLRSYTDNLRSILLTEYKAGTTFTREVIESILNPKRQSGDFITFYQQHLHYLSSKFTHNYIRSYTTSRNTFIQFAGKSIPFSKITSDLLERFETHMRTGDAARKIKPISHNTVYLRSRHLHEVISKAIAHGYMQSAQVAYYTWPSYVEPTKDYLTLSQTEKIWLAIINGELKHNPALHLSAVYFILECYSGLRVSDWSRWQVEKIIDTDALKVRARKNGEPVYLFLDKFTRLAAVLDYIKQNNLKFDISEQLANRNLKILAAHCGIPLNLTTHTARHTFGTLLAVLGYNTKQIADLMGVSEETAKQYAKNTRQGVRAAQERYGGL